MDALESRLQAARTGAAVGPVTARGLIRLHGRDRQRFVHRMCTQDVSSLGPGAAAHVAFLNVKGHVVGEGTLVVRPEDLLLDVEPAVAEPLRAHLVKYVVMDQVKLEDVSSSWRVVPVLGPAGAELARRCAPASAAWENGRRGAPALDVGLAPEEAEAFRSDLVGAGAVPLDEPDLEVLRVLAGFPRFGADLDERRLPMEAGLVRTAVSFDKGCYLGQEVVLRGTFRGQVQRGLVQLALPAGALAGASLTASGQEVGVVTSAVDAPGGRVGLGYLRRAHWKEGERLATAGGEAIVRRVLVEERES
jgi:tRNA-modifying protein YgfZ